MFCDDLRTQSPSALRALIMGPRGRALAAALGIKPGALAGAAARGALASLCGSSRPGVAQAVAMLEEGAAAVIRSVASDNDNGGTAVQQLDNCKVFYDAAGNMRVQCPQPSNGACGCNACTRPNTNCIPAEPSFAPCTVDSVCKAYKLAPFTASIVIAPPTGNTEPVSLFERVSATRFILTVLPIGASSKLCMTSIAVQIRTGAGIDVVVVPQSAGFSNARLRKNPQGTWVWAWDTPQVVYGPNFTITDMRCTCPPGELCSCQVYNGPTRVQFDLLASQLTAGEVLSVTIGYFRENCGLVQCAPCEPGDLCNYTELRATYGGPGDTQYAPQSYLWTTLGNGNTIPPQEPVLSYAGNF